MFLFNKVKEIGANVAEKSKSLINNLQKDIQDVIQQQNQLIANSESESFKEKNVLFPWEGLKAIKSNQNGNMVDAIKEDILELSLSEDYFLIDDENYMYPFQFNIDDYKYQAMKILTVDSNLEFMRSQLVPKKIKDEKFWKNYFYNIEIIKMKYNMANKINQTEKFDQVAINIDIQEGEKNNNNNTNNETEQKDTHNQIQHAEDEEDHMVVHNDEDDFNSSIKPKKNRFNDQDEDNKKKESGDDFDIAGINLSDGTSNSEGNKNVAVEMANITK